MRALIYCRVSRKEQVQRYSLADQEADCRELCRRNGWTVDGVFVEKGESAKTTDRPEFQRMLGYCREHKGSVQYVVVIDLSRFARDRFDHHAVLAYLSSLGIGLRSVREPGVDDSIPGQLLDSILSAVHWADNAYRRERTVRGMRSAIEDGKWCWHAPFGYKQRGGWLEPDPERAPLITRSFELVAGGYSVDAARAALTEEGLKLSRSRFWELLKSPVYAGWIECRSWGMRAKGRHQPLVTEEIWNRVQVVLAHPGGKVYRMDNPDFPLRRFVVCGRCGRAYTGGWSKGRNGRHGYYRCANPACKSKNVRKEVFEEQFVELLRRVQPSERLLGALKSMVLEVLNQDHEATIAARNQLRREVERLEERRKRLVEAYIYDKAIDREMYEEQLDQIHRALSAARLRALEAETEQLDAEGTWAFAERISRNAASLWAQFNPAQKKRFQQYIFPTGAAYADGAFLNRPTSPLFRGLEPAGVAEKREWSPQPDRLRTFFRDLEDLRAALAA